MSDREPPLALDTASAAPRRATRVHDHHVHGAGGETSPVACDREPSLIDVLRAELVAHVTTASRARGEEHTFHSATYRRRAEIT